MTNRSLHKLTCALFYKGKLELGGKIMDTHFDSRIKGFDLPGLKSPEKNNEYIPSTNGGLNDVKKSVELLENQLGKSLAGFSPVNELNPANFTPTAVADRILGFVETAIAQRAGGEVEAQSMLQQAREGIAQGFAEARDILSGMSTMTDKITEQVDKTESLIFKGLNELQNSLGGAADSSPSPQLISEIGSLSSQFKQSSEASIQIVTRDGDKVDVSYSALLEFSESKNYSVNQQGASASFESLNFSSASFQFSVQGNLDKGEQKAINELLENVGELANEFFNGDVQAAFNSAMELGFDSSELKGFALDFQQSTYVEVVQTYQRTEQINQPVTRELPESSVPNPTPAIDVLSQLEQLIEQTKQAAKIEAPQDTIKSLLSGMLNLMNEGVKSPLQDYIKDNVEHL